MTFTVPNTKLEKLRIIYLMLVLKSKSVMKTLKYQTFRKKCFTTSDYNKLKSKILETKAKEKRLVDKSSISNLIKNAELKT